MRGKETLFRSQLEWQNQAVSGIDDNAVLTDFILAFCCVNMKDWRKDDGVGAAREAA